MSPKRAVGPSGKRDVLLEEFAVIALEMRTLEAYLSPGEPCDLNGCGGRGVLT